MGQPGLGPRCATVLAAGLLAASTAACALAPVAVGGEEAAMAQGMGCEQAANFTFVGETSLQQLGLAEDMGMIGRDAGRVGSVVVTADRISLHGPGPLPPGIPDEVTRMVCVQWPDGSGMAGPIPDAWQLPSAFDIGTGGDDFEPPYVLIGLVVSALLIAAVSFFAFRSEPTR